MTVDDSVVQKLWKLTNELTAQLVFNRNATLELKQQLADLQASNSAPPAKTSQSTNSVLIPQNIPLHITQEHADISLRIANERLMEENSQLQEQLREYERWMEYIMTKFRLQNFAMAQSRKEAMYEAYRMAEQEGELTKQLQAENALLQSRLSDVGAVARKAVNEEYYNTESIIETLEIENQGLREMLGVATDSFSPMAMRHPGNRVSFPSTNSYVASSGSDREQQGHGSIASPSPSEQAVKGSSTSMTASVHPTPRARKSTSDSSIGTATNSGTTENTETRKPATARKKSDETVPAITNTKSGMSVNTSTVPKRNSSLTGAGNANASTSHASSSSTAQKTKKINRKQKA
ncbi:hypothetical protein BGZ80_011628 [Entomortierella chlamydospora]|uniref:Uncharacterized protein n=1 Tax=Entomortierella chlamydospora TaxID=101097 RepID=A0A9P6MT87_9FUNG|nr:hypothetical protein BGZ80_011628 [Entomortierella chlamydospora]